MSNTEEEAVRMSQYAHIRVPEVGERITSANGQLHVPDHPVIPFIEGDGIGTDIWPATQRVLDAAVETTYGGRRRIEWMEIYAGEKAQEAVDEVLPTETFDAVRDFKVAIKGPLTTPVGSGYRSLNVTLRKVLDLYACIRPIRYIPGMPSPLKEPEKVDFVVFRENTEDVYSGIEWQQGTAEAKKVIAYLHDEFGVDVREDSGIGVKPMSVHGSKRLVRKAIQYALNRNRRSVTLVHKGNIMKFTEGAFMQWGYDLAAEEFSNETITEDEVWKQHNGEIPRGKVMINDRIADIMFQHALTRAEEFDVLATPNLNGDYLSDACAAMVGGVGIAAGANIGDEIGLFEATHGSAPKHAGKDKANPTALLLSGVMMLEHMGWNEAAQAVQNAIDATISQKRVTYDLERQMDGAEKLAASEYAEAIVENLS